jgi:hypothetical protein
VCVYKISACGKILKVQGTLHQIILLDSWVTILFSVGIFQWASVRNTSLAIFPILQVDASLKYD